MPVRALALAAAFAILPALAIAQTPEQRAAMKAACEADLKRVCPDAIGNDDKVRACLRSNIMSVSGACRSAAMAAR